jgi:hypothetical protein
MQDFPDDFRGKFTVLTVDKAAHKGILTLLTLIYQGPNDSHQGRSYKTERERRYAMRQVKRDRIYWTIRPL